MNNLTLLFDCETTGKANMKAPAHDMSQPRLVQLAALLVEDDVEVASVNVVVQPEGFVVPPDAEKVHGLSTEWAAAVGVRRSTALDMFRDLLRPAGLVVAHNLDFDLLVLRHEFSRTVYADPFEGKEQFCTMKAATPVCRLPGAYGAFKWPKLAEVYQHAFGEPLVGAHDAMADLRATWRVYRWLMGQVKPQIGNIAVASVAS